MVDRLSSFEAACHAGTRAWMFHFSAFHGLLSAHLSRFWTLTLRTFSRAVFIFASSSSERLPSVFDIVVFLAPQIAIPALSPGLFLAWFGNLIPVCSLRRHKGRPCAFPFDPSRPGVRTPGTEFVVRGGDQTSLFGSYFPYTSTPLAFNGCNRRLREVSDF
jgi:hypothetical protein